MSHSHLFKYILIGDAGVGKSCLFLRFTNRRLPPVYDCTIGVEFASRKVIVGDKTIKLSLWDTAGAEVFRSIANSYYRGVAAALLVFDVTRRETFNNLSKWLDDARELASPDITIMLIGNKCDLAHERVVSTEEGEQFAKENGLLYIESSSIHAYNVEEAFMKTAEKILQNINEDVIEMPKGSPGITIGSNTGFFAGNGRCCG